MKLDLKKIKGLIIDKTKEFVQTYTKIVFAALVVLALLIVCGITLVNRIAQGKIPSGVMMTVADVAAENEPFKGKTFYVDGITYHEMVNVSYESDQMAEVEKTKKEIDEILSAKNDARQDQAALNALSTEHQGAESYAYYDPTYQDAETAISIPSSTQTPEYTYADENGTYVSLGEFELTAYCPCPICCGAYSNMENPTTASGTRATQGRTIAADTSILPFGTKVVINGKVYTVEDTGSAIKGNRIDIYFESHTEALYFGRQKATVYRVE